MSGHARVPVLRACARRALAGALVALLAGCASTATDPRDPYEGFNRAMYTFNDKFDTALAKPVATGYEKVVPGPLRDRVRNFFSNIGDVLIGANNLLQGKVHDAASDWLRVAFNTTFGLLGINDVASEMGLEKHDEDFGQTLGRWGVDSGPYVVLPILGPSTVRDTGGLVFDIGLDPLGEVYPVRTRNQAVVLRAVGKRADLLGASSILEQAALDKYTFLRDAYLQRRRSQIYDGNPPREKIMRAPPAAEPGPTLLKADAGYDNPR